MRVLGIDPGSIKLGWCYWNGKEHKHGTIKAVAGWETMRRFEYMDRQLSHVLSSAKCDLVVMEDCISHGPNHRGIRTTIGFNFMVQYKLFKINKNIILVSPTKLKKFATDKGNANKIEMVKAAQKYIKLPFNESYSDEADAFWLCKWGMECGS